MPDQMRIVRLRDKTGVQVTPMTHIDSVMNSKGVTIGVMVTSQIKTAQDTLQKNIDTNATNIQTNKEAIAVNARDIATNLANISTNATNLANHIKATTGDNAHALASDTANGFMSAADFKKLKGIDGNINNIHRFANAAINGEASLLDAGVKGILRVKQGQDINVSAESTSITNGNDVAITVAHAKVTKSAETNQDEVTLEPGGASTKLLLNVATSDYGHVTGSTTRTIKIDPKIKVERTTSSDTVAFHPVAVATNTTGLQQAKSLDGITYNPSTTTLSVSGISTTTVNLSGAVAGGVAYSTGEKNVATTGAGKEGQLLSSGGAGAPVWINNTGINGNITPTHGKDSISVAVPLKDASNANFTIEAATAAQAGVVTTTAQTFEGDKTFNKNVNVVGNLKVQGTLETTTEMDVVVADKVITLAASKVNTSKTTGNGGGIEVTTSYDSKAESITDQYKGPNLRWYATSGWDFGSTDTIVTGDELSVNLQSGASYKLNNTKVITQEGGVTKVHATADKTAASISFTDQDNASKATFDGSKAVTINATTLSAVTEKAFKVHEDLLVGNGTAGHMRAGTGLSVAASTGTVAVIYGTGGGLALAENGSAGSANEAARADHVHPFPSLNSCADILSVSKGGTGVTEFPAGQLLIGNGQSGVDTVAKGKGALMCDGTGAPSFRAVKTTELLVDKEPNTHETTGVLVYENTNHFCTVFEADVLA